ncbi:MAG: hypothetical protein DCC75_12375 [Proteobacteria bacterium]|nr:MAG: hypothetical protein DCC75_12375 [Pseudomonadota bacterium]
MVTRRFESFTQGILWSSLLNLAARFLQFLIAPSVAYLYGAGEQADIYFFAAQTATLAAISLVCINSNVIIPRAMAISDFGESMRYINSFLAFYLVFALGLGLAVYASPIASLELISDFSAGVLERQRELIELGAVSFLLQVVVLTLSEIAFANKFFLLPVFVTGISALGTLLGILCPFCGETLSSALLGQIYAQAFLIGFMALLLKMKLRWSFFKIECRIDGETWRNIGWSYAGQITTFLAGFAPLYLLSSFPAGAVSILTFAQVLAAIPTIAIANQFSAVCAVRFNELAAKADLAGQNRVWLRSARAVILATSAIAIVLAYLSEWLVAVIYSLRNAAESAQTAGVVFALLVAAAPMAGLNSILSRVVAANKQIFAGLINQIASNLLMVALICFGVSRYGIEGYALGTVVYWSAQGVLLLELCRRALPWLSITRPLLAAVLGIALVLVAGYGRG